MYLTIPANTIIYYSKKKNCIIIKTLNKYKKLFLMHNFNLVLTKQKIFILIGCNNKLSNVKIKKLKVLKKITFSLLKRLLIEIRGNFYKKLKLNGIGYKVFNTNYKNILLFKLGYTHSIYFKVNFNSIIYRNTKLFLKGNSYQNLINTSFLIKLLKWPEPYKGKGIFFFNEKIQLKAGKKV